MFFATSRLLLKSYFAATGCAVGVAVGLNKATAVRILKSGNSTFGNIMSLLRNTFQSDW